MPLRILIVGGGIMGAASAWWLTRGPNPPAVTLVERDPTLAKSSTMLSAASIRQQFSTPENIRASRFGWAFLADAASRLGADVALRRRGYLILASPGGRAALEANVAVQRAEGAETLLLEPAELARRFPWLSLDGIGCGALGADEGWFDPAALHGGFRRGSRDGGAVWVKDEVVGLRCAGSRVRRAILRHGGEIEVDAVVNAAGALAAAIAGAAAQRLPVRPDIRTVFVLDAPDAASLAGDAPLLVDPSGFWMRPEGTGFIAGMASPAQPADPWSLPVDWPLFEAELWPRLAARVPAFERLKVASAWAGPYDWNEWDQNAILGADPRCENLFHVCGFSGHGLQQAPAMGRAIAELVLEGGFRTLDFAVFSPTRFAEGRRVTERNVI
jgi:sarcosine oxidase